MDNIEQSVVGVTRADKYDLAAIQPAVTKALNSIGGIGWIKPGCKVLVKINHLSPPSPAERGIVTHPAFTEAVLNILKTRGINISVADDIEEGDLDGFIISGYRQMCDRLGIKLVNLRETGFTAVKFAGKILPEIYLSRTSLEADVIVNLPKFKTHSLTLFTGGIKNMYGIIPAGLRRKFHGDFVRTDDFCQMLVDVFAAAKPQLTIMDGIMAMAGEGPGSGKMKNLGLILASRDAVSLDAVAAHIVGINAADVNTTVFAAERGLGTADLSKIVVAGEKLESVVIKGFKLPATVSRKSMRYMPKTMVKFGVSQISPRPHVKRKNCTACRECAKACPTGAVTIVARMAKIDFQKCIRCMCCHEVCRYQAIDPRRPFFGQIIYAIITTVRKATGNKKRRS